MNGKLAVCGVLIAITGAAVALALEESGRARDVGPGSAATTPGRPAGFVVGRSVKNDVSPPLRAIPPQAIQSQREHVMRRPLTGLRSHAAPAGAVQRDLRPLALSPSVKALAMPAAILSFDGIPFPGVGCGCAPPSATGAAGATQYVQAVNEGYQVFDKTTGASVLGPLGLTTLWTGFGGVCETHGFGDPVVLYDHLANRWVLSEFAGTSIPTDECVAVSTTDDATGTYIRYDFTLGSNYFDYPKLAVWPDAYYLSTDVLNPTGTVYLGPQPFALDRAAMLAGSPATLISPGVQTSLVFMLPGDLDGSIMPPAGAPDPWLNIDDAGFPWALYRFHVDFVTPANSTFTLGGSLTPAAFTDLCPTTISCVPQLGTTDKLEAVGEFPMFRLAYRRFADGHEALVGNRSVSSGGVAGIRWWEINNATSGTPSFVQESTYQPDTTWRWMGSAAMDNQGNLAIGFSASSASIYPEIRYAGRLATDATNTLAQGEATLFAGTGSQTDTSSRWGDYSDLTVDPIDECTFWYTNEYYATTDRFNWRTRIGSFTFPSCVPAQAAVSGTKTVSGTFKLGGAVTYTVTLSNTGNRDQMDNPGHEFTDILPAALTLVGAAASSGTAVATLATNTVTWDGAIPAGGSVTITINATIKIDGSVAGTTVSNQGTISFDANGDGTNDTTVVTDDPGAAGGSDPTSLMVEGLIPTLSSLGLVALVICVLAAGLLVSRRLP